MQETEKDHPRVCGENIKTTRRSADTGGSPPRVRGKLHNSLPLCYVSRITPACAGKTLHHVHDFNQSEDHPRVCGENGTSPRIDISNLGSPPRVRGKPRTLRAVRAAVGITPACAGKTANVGTDTMKFKDHPRVCGENRQRRCMINGILGSPPRVRGKQGNKALKQVAKRITPACAGKTELDSD